MSAVLLSPWVRNPVRRRVSLAIIALLLAVLSVWPRSYVARAQLLPNDSGGGLASLLGASGGGALASLGALVGGRQSIESDLTIARSLAVADDVARRLQRDGLGGGKAVDRTAAALRHGVDVEAIRGGILQIAATDRDPVRAKAIVSDYVAALRARLAALDIEQTTQKKAVAAGRMADATVNLSRAQEALDRFRLVNRLAVPQAELGGAIALVTELQGRLQAQEADLETLEHFATPDNFRVQTARAQVAALRGQIAAAQAAAKTNGGPSVGGITPKISEYENLYRDEKYAEAEYEIYKRYLDTTAVQTLSAGINLDVIEPPYVDPDRQFNVRPLGALILVLLAAVIAEVYIADAPAMGAPRRTQ